VFYFCICALVLCVSLVLGPWLLFCISRRKRYVMLSLFSPILTPLLLYFSSYLFFDCFSQTSLHQHNLGWIVSVVSPFCGWQPLYFSLPLSLSLYLPIYIYIYIDIWIYIYIYRSFFLYVYIIYESINLSIDLFIYRSLCLSTF
jgi:hypothetical protein